MIWKGSKNILSAWMVKKAVHVLYKGATLIWRSVSSAFGGGFWLSDYVWSNEDTWKQNND